MEALANDAVTLLDYFEVKKVHRGIQGGAAILHFSLKYADQADRVVASDTHTKTAAANVKAWMERIEFAKRCGMWPLAEATDGRWFPPGSRWTDDE